MKDVESWKATFHNPSTPPASHTKTLLVARPWAATAADVEEGGWVKTFSCVVHLEIDLRKADADPDQFVNYLVPFHGFSPAIKSPRLDYIPLPLQPILDLIHSFPLLEGLSVPDGIRREVEIDDGFDRQLNTLRTLGQPAFTGFLELCGVNLHATHLLSLPSGLRFRNLLLTLSNEVDISSTISLVESCCPILKSLYIDFCS